MPSAVPLIRSSIAVALVLTGRVADAQAPDPFAGLPDVEIEYYDVRGRDPQAIRAAMNVARPVDPADGQGHDGWTRWDFHWRWSGDGHGHCDLAATQLTYSAVVRLPRLVGDDVPRPVRELWERYLAALKVHEAMHARYPYEHRDAVLAAIKGATCDTADAAGKAVLMTLVEHEKAYDVATRHGMTKGAVFP